MKKILISAFIGSDNLGDQAIFESIVGRLHKNKDLDLAAFTLDRTKYKTTPFVRFIETLNPFRVTAEIYRCDLLVIGGGGIIQDETTVYNLIRHTYKAVAAWVLGKKYMFFAVGISPVRSKVNKILARVVLQNAEAVTVRDSRSKINAQSLGVTKKIVVTADPVVGLDVEYKKQISKRPYVIVSLRHWFDIHRYIPVEIAQSLSLRSQKDGLKYESFTSTLAQFFDWVIDNYKYRMIFLPFFDQRDDHIASDVIAKMNYSNLTKNISKQQTIPDTVSLIAGAECLIGMRLHSLIIGACVNTPFLALSYSEKVANFTHELGLQQFGHDIEKLSVASLQDCFERMVSGRKIIKGTLRRRMHVLKERDDENYKILEEIIYPAPESRASARGAGFIKGLEKRRVGYTPPQEV